MLGRSRAFMAVAVTWSVGVGLLSVPGSAGALAWSRARLVDPGQTLTGISCPSRSLCVAVDASGDVLVSNRPAGRNPGWKGARIDRRGQPTGVACASRSLCVVVDDDGRVLTTTHPSGGPRAWRPADVDTNGSLLAVSCPSSSLCVAVDDQGDVISSTHPTGGARAWHSATVSDLSSLTGISCPSVRLCVAVSDSSTAVTSTHPDRGARAWHQSTVAGSDSEFSAVSCPSKSLCVAVDDLGNIATSSRPATSRRWKLASVDPDNAIDVAGEGISVGLTGVSCASRSDCVASDAAGNVFRSTRPTRGARSWRRTHLGGTANSARALSFSGVACPSRSLCVAVDESGNAVTGAPHRLPVPLGRRCGVHRPGAAFVTTQVLVFPVVNPSATNYFACVRPNGAGGLLGTYLAGNGEYGSNGTTGGFRAAGVFVAAQSTSGLADVTACTKYGDTDCPPGDYWIRALDASDGRHVDLTTSPSASAVTLSPSGAIAWIQSDSSGQRTLIATALHPGVPGALTAKPQPLDTGGIDPSSLRFAGLTLYWASAGRAHQQTLS